MSQIFVISFFSTAKFFMTLLPVFAAGVFAAELMVALGWINKIAWITRPLTRMGNLQQECGASFLTAFLSPAAGNAMLVQNHEAGIIGRRELIISAIVNTFPGIVMHWRTMLPIAIPLIGKAGLVYYGFLVLVGLIKTLVALFIGRFFLNVENISSVGSPFLNNDTAPLTMAVVQECVRRSWSIIFRVIKTTIPVTLVMFFIIHAGIFDHLSHHFSDFFSFIPLSPEALSIVVTRIGSNIGGFTVAGNLLYTGSITSKEMVISLLLGNLLAVGTNLRYLIPYYFGVFGPGLGIQVLTVSTGLRVIIMTGLLSVLFQVWL